MMGGCSFPFTVASKFSYNWALYNSKSLPFPIVLFSPVQLILQELNQDHQSGNEPISEALNIESQFPIS